MSRPAPGSSPIPTPRPSSRNASTRPRRCSAPPKRPSDLRARRGGDNSLPPHYILLAALPRRFPRKDPNISSGGPSDAKEGYEHGREKPTPIGGRGGARPF